MTFPADDNAFQEHQITKVDDEDDRWCAHMGSTVLSFPKVDGATPKEGSTLRTYGRGFGFPVRGVFVDGNKVYYRTEAEDTEEHKRRVAEQDQKKRDEAKANEAEVDARVAKLPGPFQDRIAGFRARNPNFRWEFEPYELFCCEQAVEFTTTLKSPEAIEKFAKADYKEQMAMVPNLSHDHSGNTMGMSLRLAHMFASDQMEFVRKAHGAMCPLVGCSGYGCYAASDEAKALAASEKDG